MNAARVYSQVLMQAGNSELQATLEKVFSVYATFPAP